ncbi:hypothetical protein FHS27_006535 [Rhodopirellula rubra]|uniref:Uncharacterized protein n=1 Tax=Aporhodopirellula rubra TaxID=980271 RepID=A0A7W5E6G9_9BACT|nr:hypothetical protein [Aporhodopirellula rubra]
MATNSTHTADYRYILKELPAPNDSSVWALECYPETQQLPFIGKHGSMYLRFKPNTPKEVVDQIRSALNTHVENITVIN